MLVVYGRSTPVCPFCIQAKNMLEAANIPFEYKDLAKNEWSIKELEDKFSVSIRTVPFIIQGNKIIGGAAELAKYLKGVVNL